MITNPVDVASLYLQIINLQMLIKDIKNTDLMEQLNLIIEQNNKIIELLERRDNNERND